MYQIRSRPKDDSSDEDQNDNDPEQKDEAEAVVEAFVLISYSAI